VHSLIALTLIVGCKPTPELTLQSDPTITAVFDEPEIKDLQIILDFFTEHICPVETIEDDRASECYRNFLVRMLTEPSYDFAGITFHEQQEMYSRISNSTFGQIWFLREHQEQRSGATVESLNMKWNGKYMKFLEKLGNDYDLIKEYYFRILDFGDILPSQFARVLTHHESYDTKDVRVRLFLAIHFLTLNDPMVRIPHFFRTLPKAGHIAGTWKQEGEQVNYTELEFAFNGDALFKSRGDTVFRFRYELTMDSLVLVDHNGTRTSHRIVELTKDSLILQSLFEVKDRPRYSKL